jgi:hypothetical protein
MIAHQVELLFSAVLHVRRAVALMEEMVGRDKVPKSLPWHPCGKESRHGSAVQEIDRNLSYYGVAVSIQRFCLSLANDMEHFSRSGRGATRLCI